VAGSKCVEMYITWWGYEICDIDSISKISTLVVGIMKYIWICKGSFGMFLDKENIIESC
jgi:hypothetical protein